MGLSVTINTEKAMNAKMIKEFYTAPVAEMILLPMPMNLLVSVSIDAGFEDWEEGEEL